MLHFDPSLPVLVWRGVGRVVCRGRRVSGDEWSIQPIISDICTAMETKAVECVQCAPGETEVNGSLCLPLRQSLYSSLFPGLSPLEIILTFELTRCECKIKGQIIKPTMQVHVYICKGREPGNEAESLEYMTIDSLVPRLSPLTVSSVSL